MKRMGGDGKEIHEEMNPGQGSRKKGPVREKEIGSNQMLPWSLSCLSTSLCKLMMSSLPDNHLTILFVYN